MTLRELLAEAGFGVGDAPIQELDDDLETISRLPVHYLYGAVCPTIHEFLAEPGLNSEAFQERVHELLAAAMPDGERHPSETDYPSPSLEASPIAWASFWSDDHHQEWIIEPIVPRGSLVELYATAKAGKSLLALQWSAALATGKPALHGEARDPADVVYIDAEMTQLDLKDRLSDLGYGPDDDLSHLHYYSLQQFQPLDTEKGGDALVRIAIEHNAELVVVDTVSRVISGKENDADTFHALYRYTQMRLKAAGIASLWLDHSGKDQKKGPRGSSAKGQVADVVWQLNDSNKTVDEGRLITLHAKLSRPQLPTPSLKLIRKSEPLRHEPVGGNRISQRATELAKILDELGVPRDAGRDRARQELSISGEKASNADLAEAIRWRKRYPDSPNGQVPRTVEMDRSGQVVQHQAPVVGATAKIHTDRLEGQPDPDLFAAGASLQGTPAARVCCECAEEAMPGMLAGRLYCTLHVSSLPAHEVDITETQISDRPNRQG